jgi:hypothetical protein
MRQDALDCDRALESARAEHAAKEDFGHATRSKSPDDLVATQPAGNASICRLSG